MIRQNTLSLAAVLAVLCSVFLFTSMAVAAELPNTPHEPFTDVSASSPYLEAIEYLRTNGVIVGYTDGTFRPERQINRADFLQLMTNPLFLHGRDESCVLQNTTETDTTVFFPDVPKGAYFATNVCIAKTGNLVNGYLDGYFRPQRPVSFVEAAKVIARVFTLDVRRDAPPTDNWYKIYVDVLSGKNAIPASINVNSQVSLSRSITRGEMAWMIYTVSQTAQNK